MPVAARFIEITGAVATDRYLYGGVDVSGRQSVAGGLGAIDIDLDRGLAKRREHRQISNSLYRGQDRFDFVCGIGECLEIVAKQLDRVFTLNARYRLGNVVLKVLREIEFNPGELVLQFRQQSSREFLLIMGIGPFAGRLQRRKEFRIEKS